VTEKNSVNLVILLFSCHKK